LDCLSYHLNAVICDLFQSIFDAPQSVFGVASIAVAAVFKMHHQEIDSTRKMFTPSFGSPPPQFEPS
jgi:hypothetical protein